MAKKPFVGVRLDPETKAALERAAEADQRTVSAMAAKIITDTLRNNVLDRRISAGKVR